MNLSRNQSLSIALPKGRLLEEVRAMFKRRGILFSFEKRKLVANDESNKLKLFLVKNSDLPTYVNHGIAGLGICGSDILYESGYKSINLFTFTFGSTTTCFAKKRGADPDSKKNRITIATKYTNFTRDYFHSKGIPVQIIQLNGSVELAPVLGLAPYIVDLVETGETIKANNLEIINKLKDIKVHLIANPAYYKLNYLQINKIVESLKKG